MDDGEVLRRSRELLATAGVRETGITKANFLDFADAVRDVMLALPRAEQEKPENIDLAFGLRSLRDRFDEAVEADPMILYRPQHAVAEAFHRSLALVRFFRSGNRCSKTESARYEMYCVLTGKHPYRQLPALPVQAFTVGLSFSKYAPTVFQPKYLIGEPGNPLTPMFPENGKWFQSYDDKKHIITLGCPDCVDAGRPRSCRHPRSRMILFSDESGSDVMAGGQYGFGHLDEEVDRGFYVEGRERLSTVPHSRMVVTLTPTKGEAWWTEQTLTPTAEAKALVKGTKIPVVELFTIDQFSAGLTDHAGILAKMETLTEAEIQARIFGIPATDSQFAVFDLGVLKAMGKNDVREPKRGQLRLIRPRDADPKLTETECLAQFADKNTIRFEKQDDGWFRIWDKPDPLGQYIIGADVASGLTGRDFSVASVLRMYPVGFDIYFKLVAQFAGWIDPVLYAEELYKLGLLYQPAATLNVERNGPGDVVLKHLKDLGCWFLFHDISAIGAARDNWASLYGVDTNQRTKSVIISLLQSVFKLNKVGKQAIEIPCADTLRELRAYVQKPTESGRTLRFGADGMEHDDRVMSLALGVYAAKTAPVYDFNLEQKLRARLAKKASGDEYSDQVWQGIHEELEARARATQELNEEFDEEFA